MTNANETHVAQPKPLLKFSLNPKNYNGSFFSTSLTSMMIGATHTSNLITAPTIAATLGSIVFIKSTNQSSRNVHIR